MSRAREPRPVPSSDAWALPSHVLALSERTLASLARPDGPGSLAHYDVPGLYGRLYRDRTEDVDYYVRLAERTRGRVLEYGVGNGRIALPLARSGKEITGIDLSLPMLSDLKQRVAEEAPEVRRRVSLVHGDMRRVRLKQKFELVIAPFNVILHLYERRDLEQFLARVNEHLAPKGKFVFDYSLPQPKDLDRDPNRAYHSFAFRHPSSKERVKAKERFFYDRFRQVLLVWSEFEAEGGKSWDTPLTHRQYFPQEMEALLHYNGFAVTDYCPDFGREGWLNWADSLVVECRQRRLGTERSNVSSPAKLPKRAAKGRPMRGPVARRARQP